MTEVQDRKRSWLTFDYQLTALVHWSFRMVYSVSNGSLIVSHVQTRMQNIAALGSLVTLNLRDKW